MLQPAVRFRPPAPELRRFITTYYWVDVPGAGDLHDWLHPEWPNLRFVMEGRWGAAPGEQMAPSPDRACFGPTSRTMRVVASPPTRVVGLGLLPLGFAMLFDVEAAALADRVVDLAEHDDGAEALRLALMDDPDMEAQAARLDAYYLRRFAERRQPSTLFGQAHGVLLDPETRTVETFAARLGISPRHLARLCRRLFGFPPKLLLRRQRFLRTLEAAFAAQDRPFAEVLDAAYFDQSHFVRDFHDFMGVSPSRYFQQERPLLTVAQSERLKTLGASFQGLQHARARLEAIESGSSKRLDPDYG